MYIYIYIYIIMAIPRPRPARGAAEDDWAEEVSFNKVKRNY